MHVEQIRNIRWHRGRGINHISNFIPDMLNYIRDDFHILELGCGLGRAILELNHLFPNSKITGINHPNENIFIKDAILNAKDEGFQYSSLPQIIAYDLNKDFPFEDNSFEVIFSQTCYMWIDQKIKFLNECLRVLKPNGKIFIDLNGTLYCNNIQRFPKEYVFGFEKENQCFFTLNKKTTIMDIKFLKSTEKDLLKTSFYINSRKFRSII